MSYSETVWDESGGMISWRLWKSSVAGKIYLEIPTRAKAPAMKTREMQCYVCGKEVPPAVRPMEEDDVWQFPQGLHFADRGNYGSSVHDSLMCKARYEVVICDPCLARNWNRGRLVKFEEQQE